MKLSVEHGEVVCSLDNKNGEFLWACTGLFDGFLNGKLKMYKDKPEEWAHPEAAVKYNAKRLEEILRNARKYGVEAEESVEVYNSELQALAREIEARERALKEEQALQEKWLRLCKNGCGRCRNLAYDVDLPICKRTGEILKEKNAERYVGGVLHLFNPEPFPSEDCPFNINKKTRSNK